VNKGTSGQGRGRIRVPRPVLVILGVLLLAVGAAALTAARGSAEHGVGPLARQWWLFAAVGLGLGIFALVKLRERFSATDPESTAQARLVRGVLVVGAVLTVALPIGLYLSRFQSDGGVGSCAPDCPALPATGVDKDSQTPLALPTNAPVHNAPIRLPLGPILLVLGGLLAALVVVGLVLLYLKMRNTRIMQLGIDGAAPPALSDQARDEEALSAAVLAGRGALEGEARAAIIACYAAMEDSLAAAGVTRLESDSPADLLRRATEHGVVAGPAPRLLAALFREARFSTHPIGARHLDQARGALDEITAQLEARRAAARAADAAREAESAAAGDGGGAAGGSRAGAGTR
jgi:Domain of unknown function (DUF4129)